MKMESPATIVVKKDTWAKTAPSQENKEREEKIMILNVIIVVKKDTWVKTALNQENNTIRRLSVTNVVK